MSDVTDADRTRAWEALRQANENDGYTLSDDEARVEAIAAALAEEREKARAPFLALADEIEAACRGRQDVVSMTMRDDAALIRVTLDDNQ